MSQRPSYPVSNLDYDLPPELIAQHPAPQRTGSRLLYVDMKTGKHEDRNFIDLPDLLPEQTLIYLNDSKVIPARIQGKRASGGAVELLYLEYAGAGVIGALVGSNAKLSAGELVKLPDSWTGELLEPKVLDGLKVQLRNGAGHPATQAEVIDWLQRNGEVPLPPYIRRGGARPPPAQSDQPSGGRQGGPPTNDADRYQTVYAAHAGSAAAPTAGLHFDATMLARLRSDGHSLRHLTLHVGTGTFAPLRVEDLKDHVMHEEPYTVAPKVAEEYLAAYAARQPLMAVGTTSLRILHTLQSNADTVRAELASARSSQEATGGPLKTAGADKLRPYDPSTSAISGRTAAFIYPGHGTDAARLLLTNFHLPRSTLLALVYAFGGEDLMREVYAHAVRARYRFFSYGDCMLIDRGP